MEAILTQSTAPYTLRRSQLEGKPHIVVPVVMMVEGVHSGSHGPLLHTAQDLSHVVGAWNGIPVTILHPTDSKGQNISANSPTVCSVGRIFNAHMDGVKLKAEAWIDESKLLATSPLASAYISEGRPLDVSIGVFTDEESTPGEWNGEQYTAIARNHRPDHLALLPGEQGACSWADGCGVRTNKKGGASSKSTEVQTNNDTNEMTEIEQWAKIKKEAIERISSALMQTNQLSISGRVQKLSALVDSMDKYDESTERYTEMHGMEEVYNDYIIYRKSTRDAQGARQEQYLRQSYSVNADDTVSLIDTPVQVRKDVNYVQVNAQEQEHEPKPKRTKFPNTNKDDMTKPSACLVKKVDALINNEVTQFEESDRDFLLTQSEGVLDKMLPKAVETPPAPQVNAEQVQAYIRETFKKPEEFVKMLPNEMQDQMDSALKLHASKRKSLIQGIIANTAEGTWAEDELSAMKTDMLDKIAKSVQANKHVEETFDYSGNGRAQFQANAGDDDEVLFPTGYGVKK